MAAIKLKRSEKRRRLIGDIYYHPLDVGLAFKQLSFTRLSERSTLDQPIFNRCMVRQTVDLLTA